MFGKEHVAERIHCRQHKAQCVNARVMPATMDLAARGLVKMGFRKRDVCRALDLVQSHRVRDATAPPVEEVLREALAVLT